MKKILLLLVAAAFAVSPATAETKSKTKKSKEATEAEEIAKQHDNTKRAVRDSLPLFLPSWSLPVFFGTGMDKKLSGQDEKKAEKKVKKTKSTQAQ